MQISKISKDTIRYHFDFSNIMGGMTLKEIKRPQSIYFIDFMSKKN
jgi:hypothetical protein